MRTHLVAVLGITLSVALGAAPGCGVDPRGERDQTAVQSDAPSLAALDVPHFFTVRRDLCRDAPPERRHCGWFVQALSGGEGEVHVDDLDLSRARLGTGKEGLVLDAPEEDLVLRGSLGERALVVLEVFRGMPGLSVRAVEDGTYAVRCETPACDRAVAYRVDTLDREEIAGVSVDRVLLPYVSREWLLDRVEQHGALIVGHLASGGMDRDAPAGKIFEASQVFVGLPFASGPCLLLRHICAAPLVPTYTRDAGLCLDFAACVRPGVCPLWRPACAEGYRLTTWLAGDHACPAYACDPAFLHPGATEDGATGGGP
jgi:hypothetical protein